MEAIRSSTRSPGAGRALDDVVVFPNTHYATSDERLHEAIGRIEKELQERLAYFEREGSC